MAVAREVCLVRTEHPIGHAGVCAPSCPADSHNLIMSYDSHELYVLFMREFKLCVCVRRAEQRHSSVKNRESGS